MATTREKRGWVRVARRYGPIVVVLGIVAAVVAVFAGGDGDDGEPAAGEGTTSNEELLTSGPMTWQRAEAEGVTEEIDWGPNCDTGTGKIKLPTIYAAPCVEPFEGDNGGATATGVTEDTIKIVAYVIDPEVDPIGAAIIAGAGADTDPGVAMETMQDYMEIFNAVFETYGRTVELEFYTGTGPNEDVAAARSDAIAIAEMEPFAVLGGPLQANAPFSEELAARGVISLPGQPLSERILVDNYPLIWGLIPPEQAATMAAEAIGKLAGPGPAELAGDAAVREQERRYAIVYYNTPDGDYTASIDILRDGLAEAGIEVAENVEYILDPAAAQENARTIIARLKDAGVTTVIFQGDFLMPGFLTTTATQQDYFPEWILGPNLLADTEIFGRTFDQGQWGNGFALAYAGQPERQEDGDAYSIYTWAYDGAEPPSNIYTVLELPLRAVFTGIQLAGSELTVESFRDGVLRYPPTGGGPTSPLFSYGDQGIWPTFDYGGFPDDIALMWWDAEAEGEDETGAVGLGMYRFANGGARYRPGELPDSIEEAGLFDVDSSVIQYEEPPPDDRPPDYPPPDLSAAGAGS